MAPPSASRIRLITRGDDAGSCESADLAILDACDHGIVRNVSIMMPGPSFAHAAQLLAGRSDLCLGLHVTLSSEWSEPRWGPVLPAAQVPTLVDASGCFFPSPGDLHQRGFSVDEALAEIMAQLRRAQDAGLKLQYFDEHMGCSWIGLRPRLEELMRREGLVDGEKFAHLPSPSPDAPADWLGRFQSQLSIAQPDAYVMINHPGMDRDDMRCFQRHDQPPGAVARARDEERRRLIDPHLQELLREQQVKIVRYTEARA